MALIGPFLQNKEDAARQVRAPRSKGVRALARPIPTGLEPRPVLTRSGRVREATIHLSGQPARSIRDRIDLGRAEGTRLPA